MQSEFLALKAAELSWERSWFGLMLSPPRRPFPMGRAEAEAGMQNPTPKDLHNVSIEFFSVNVKFSFTGVRIQWHAGLPRG